MNRRLRFASASILLGVGPALLPAETTDEFFARMEPLWNAAKTVKTKTKLVVESESMKSTSLTEIAFEPGANGHKMRTETQSEALLFATGVEPGEPMRTRSLGVSNGEVLFSETTHNGTVSVTKMKAPPAASPAEAQKKMLQATSLNVVGKETLNGEPTTVLEARHEGAEMGVSTFYFSDKSGVAVRMTNKNPASKMEMTVLEHQVLPDIDDAIFEYTPPEGATVQDLTNL
jgi:outer membrane lipoprotein-sorting protein